MKYALWGMFLILLGHGCDSLGPNIAINGKVAQSSLDWQGSPQRAVDGNRASNWGYKSCTHTKQERDPWWRLDLLRTHSINSVTLTNRLDCCSERLNGAEIRIGNSQNENGNVNPRCAVASSIAAGGSQSFDCKGMEGRYVNIVIPGERKILTLCEVEVFGVPADAEKPFSCD